MTISTEIRGSPSNPFRLGVWICRGFVLLSLGLGCSTIPEAHGGGVFLLVVLTAIIGFRIIPKRPWRFLPDGITACLPYFWALNATDSLLPWTPALLFPFTIALGSAVGVFFLFWRGRPPWRIKGIGSALFLALLSLLLFASAIKAIFPLFAISSFRRIFLATIYFFGGIPVSQVASVGILFPWQVSETVSGGGE